MGDYDNKISTKTQKTRHANQKKVDHSSWPDDSENRTSSKKESNAKDALYEDRQEDACPEHIECSIEKALDVLGGKWTFLIIRDLFSGTKRFGELRQSLNGVSPKTLSSRLRELERKNIVERRAFATIPPTVEYSLTEKGRSLKPIIKAMKVWGAKWG
jgi:DNA-binding HxlR family transcriptional regulator